MAGISIERSRAGAIVGYRVQWREGGKRTDPKQSERFSNEAAAVKFRDEVNRSGQRWPEGWVRGRGWTGARITGQPERGADARASLSVYAWADHYYRDANPALKAKPRSRAKYRARLATQLKGSPFGETALYDASREGFQAWVDALSAAGLAHSYVEGLRGIVGKTLRAAVYAGVIRVDVTAEILVPGSSDDEGFRPLYASEAQIAALIEGAPEKYRLAIRTLAETGLRYVEFAHLAPEDVNHDPQSGVYWLQVNRSKTNSGIRPVTLGDKLGIDLMALAELRRGEAQLFDIPPHHAGFHRDAWVPARTAAKLPTMRIHDLRHSHAAWLLRRGATLFVVSKRLGHKKLSITSDRYGHLSREDAGLLGILNGV